MPLQNRVTPEGDIVAVAARGTLMGNRGGCLHDGEQRLGGRRWVSRQWICCVLDFKGRRRQVMAPGRYTELFFLDEATALAAGHRPCFECRRAEALRFADVWGEAHGLGRRARADEMDRVLHAERLADDGSKRAITMPAEDLPDGAMVRWRDAAWLVHDGAMLRWSPLGYSDSTPLREIGIADVLTSPGIVDVLKRCPGVAGSVPGGPYFAKA